MTTQEFILTRTFAAPRSMVWKAFTEPERLARWWGPPGSSVRQAHMDFRPGGHYHFCSAFPDGNTIWGLFQFLEISPVDKIVYLHSFSNEKGEVSTSPFGGPWPAHIHTSLTFVEKDGRTAFTLRQHPQEASAEEIKAFIALFEGMTLGWGATFDKLEHYLVAN